MTFMLILGGAAALYMLWLLFRMAALALPLFCAIGTALLLNGQDHGISWSLAGGFLAGIGLLTVGRLAMQSSSPIARTAVGLLFAVPAGAAGYFAAAGLADLVLTNAALLVPFSLLGALLAATAAWHGLMQVPWRREIGDVAPAEGVPLPGSASPP